MTLAAVAADMPAIARGPPLANVRSLSKAMAKKPKSPIKPDTKLVTAGRDTQGQHGFVNPAVYHASTVLYPTAEDQIAHRSRYQYGRRGTPTSEALEGALTELEGEKCAGVALLPSGLAAISTALLSVAGSGDHILVTDSVYRPTRVFCDGLFKRLGVPTTYYDPLIGADIAELVQAEHQGGLRRSARLAELRDAGHPGDRRGRPCQRRDRADGQYLGHAALFPRLRQRRRPVDPGRHQIYRRPLRHHVRLRLRHCRALRNSEGNDERARPLRRAG